MSEVSGNHESQVSRGALPVLFFNARTERTGNSEQFFSQREYSGMVYCGCFPLVYSAASVVQDNRDGALRTDFAASSSRAPLWWAVTGDIPDGCSTCQLRKNNHALTFLKRTPLFPPDP